MAVWKTKTQYSDKELKRRRFIGSAKRNAAGWLLMLPTLFLLYLLVWRPAAMGIGLSFFRMEGYTPVEFVGFKNFITVMKDKLFTKTLLNTFSYVFWSIVLGYLTPLVVAILLNEVRRGQGFFKTAIYLPTVVPAIAASMIWTQIYQPGTGGLLNQFLSLFGVEAQGWLQNGDLTIMLIVISCTWKGFGSTVLLYLATLQGIDQQLYEAAKIDGAGGFRRVMTITIPQMLPMMLLFLIRQVISIFQITEQPMAMTGGGPNNASMSLGLTAYDYAFRYMKTGSSLATGAITFVILIIMTSFYLWAQKKFSVD